LPLLRHKALTGGDKKQIVDARYKQFAIQQLKGSAWDKRICCRRDGNGIFWNRDSGCADAVRGFGNPTHVCVCEFCSVWSGLVWFLVLVGLWALSTAVYLCVPLQLMLVGFFFDSSWVPTIPALKTHLMLLLLLLLKLMNLFAWHFDWFPVSDS